jgi:hypothetical protein
MIVETYEVTETLADGETEDTQSEEALALIESLGLEGQQKLVSRRSVNNGDEVVTRNPYRQLTSEEMAVFSTCFSSRADLTDYSLGMIPLRVLQVAAHAQTCLPENTTLEVWHPEDSTIRDPLLIGRQREGYNTHFWLLARWGESLEDFDTLRAIAARRLMATCKTRVVETRAKLAEFEATFEAQIEGYLLGQRPQEIYLPNLSVKA